MKVPTLRQSRCKIAVTAALTMALSACGSQTPVANELARDRQVLRSCVRDVKLASKVDLDVSGSARTSDLGAERSQVIEVVARRTAICRGHLKVTAFSVSSAATAVLYDDELVPPGATDNARLRRAPRLVEDVLIKIRAAYTANVGKLSPSRSDILGQYRLAGEYVAQLGSAYRLELVIVTDGVQTVGTVVGQGSLTPVRALAMADKVTVPKLPGATVTVTGLGKVTSGQSVPSTVVESLVVFYDTVCKQSGAAKCTSVTDFAAAGQ